MKYRKPMIVSLCIFAVTACLISYFLVQQKQEPNEPIPNPPQSEKFHEGHIVEYIDTATIDFDGYNIDIHRMDENRIYVSIQEKVDHHISSLLTRELGYINVNTWEYQPLKVFDDDTRVWDYLYIGDTLVYSKIGNATDDGIELDVIMEKDGESIVVDSLKSVWTMDAPILTRFNESIYYYSKHYEDVADNQVLVTFALKAFDLENVETIHEHTCYANLGGESTFDNGCLRGLGQIYAADETVYYYETNSIISVMRTYNPKLNLFESVFFDEVVAPGLAYFDSLDKVVAGFNVDTLTDVADIYVYDVKNHKREQRIGRELEFARPTVSGDLFVFFSGDSMPPNQTIFVDINTRAYQIFRKTNESIGFPKYYVYQNRVFAVWVDESVIIEVYEIIGQ